MAQKIIELVVKGERIHIKSPYDADLIDDIKVIPKEQREWVNKEWVIFLDDPNQKPEERTNLEYLRDICLDNAERLGWQFHDYSEKSESQIRNEKLQNIEELIDKFLAVVDELPNGALKLVRWHSDKLQLQLTTYLSDEAGGYELFMRLFNAAQDAYKPGMLAGSERRADFGFIFDIPYRDRVIRKLGEKQTRFIKYHRDLVPTQAFDDGVVHFDKGGEHWFGIIMNKCDPGSINWETRDWELFDYEGEIYWVCQTQKFVDAWAEATKYGVAHFGGSFGIFYERPEQLINRVATFHLEQWLENHIIELAKKPVTCSSGRPWIYNPKTWTHVLDKYFDKVAVPQEIREAIEQQKVQKANERLGSDRANAISLAMGELSNKFTKDEIVRKYGSQIEVKKSWSKQKILEAICTQEFSVKFLEIPDGTKEG